MEATATTGSSHSNREARRRRIAERGSDRLALITGRIQSLPPNADQSSPSPHSADQNTTDHDSAGKLNHQNNTDNVTEPLLRDINVGENIASVAAAFHGEEEQIFQVSSSSHQSPLIQHQRKHQNYCKSLTSGQIISAISASENVRMCCSVATAILVTFSYLGFPILSWGIIRSTIFFRPFYLLLVTNVSIVLARLILGKGAEVETGQVNRVTTSSGENGLVDQIGKALESGLLLQNIFGAIFMDFSIYAVVLICGLSLA